jgi:hypothetical protein
MRARGAVQVLRSAQAARQARRPWPSPGHVRLHSASCCEQVLWHAAAALPRVAAGDRPTIPTRTSARRYDRHESLLRSSTGRQRDGGRAAPGSRGAGGGLRRSPRLAQAHLFAAVPKPSPGTTRKHGAWFALDDTARPYAFVNVCAWLRLDPATVRVGCARGGVTRNSARARVLLVRPARDAQRADPAPAGGAQASLDRLLLRPFLRSGPGTPAYRPISSSTRKSKC